ncbi:MAG: Gfo/Idh/MocA family oxidoreductase [Actinobacteria bacterium]|nr:Gfo/Idh/MocA family oxidoreductase [Actinomycetota bacterium]
MLRIGVVGLGGIARTHLRALQATAAEGVAACVAAADLIPAIRDRFRQEFGIPTLYDHHTKLLDDPAIDAVAIVLGHYLHAPLTIDALNAGKHVLVEKPMAISLDECDAMIEAERKNRRILQVGLMNRWFGGFQKAREILDSNALGPVVQAVAGASYPWNLPNRRAQYRTRAMGGGMWLSNGVHTVDWLTHCIGTRAVSVKAKLGTYFHAQAADDAGLAFILYANGVAGVTYANGTKRGTERYGVQATCLEGNLEYWRDSVRVGQDGTWRTIEHGGSDGFVGQYRAFARAIATGVRPETSSGYGRHIMEVLLAAEQSSVTGREVHLTDYHLQPW